MNATLLMNSLAVGVAASALATAAGVGAAWVAASHLRWRRAILASGILCLALPPFLPANAWLEVTAEARASGAAEWVAVWTLPLVALVLAAGLWPIPLFLTLSGWGRVQPGQLDAAATHQGWTALRRLLIPAVSGELRVSLAVTLALALANFTVPTLFQVRVFTEEFWVRFNTQFDLPGALSGSWPLLLLPPIVLFWVARHPVAWSRDSDQQLKSQAFRAMSGGLAAPLAAATLGWVFLSLFFPLYRLSISGRTWSELSGALAAGGMAVRQSLVVAGAAATAIAGLGLLASRGLTFESRLGRGVMLAGWVLFLLPGVFEGVLILHSMNQPWLRPWIPGVAVLVLAVGLRYFAPAWTFLASARRTLDRDQSDAARLSGAGAWKVFRTVEWPQMRGPTAAAWYAVYLLALWDVETVVLIQPPGGETLSLRVFNLLHYGHGTQVNALCVVLLGMALLPAVIVASARWAVRGRSLAGAALWTTLIFASGCGDAGRTGAVSEEASAGTGATREWALDSKGFRGVRVMGARGVAPGQFNKPRSLVCDRSDNLYVADMTGRIQKFDRDGRWLMQWQMPQTDLGKPKGMTLDREGNVVVVEPHYQRVNHFTTEGKLVRQWGVKGTAPGELILPRSIVAASDGRFFVTEYTVVDRVQRFSADGRYELLWGSPGGEPGQFNRAEGIGIDAAGRLYVADSCNHRIQVFTADGKWIRSHGSAGAEKGKLSYPYDVRLDAAGRQVVCEFGNSRISVFGVDDQLVEVIGGAGGEPGQFANPWAIAFDSHGDLYVADSQNHRVQKLIARETSAGRRLAATPSAPVGPGT